MTEKEKKAAADKAAAEEKAAETPEKVEAPVEKTLSEVSEVVVTVGPKYATIDNEPVETSPAQTDVYTTEWWNSLYRNEKGKTVQFKTKLEGYPIWNEGRTEYTVGPLAEEEA